MARIKCIMMQRDETQLLEPWLRYHGRLFGYPNLTVIDHGSREAEVISVLERYKSAGVRVERLPASPGHYAKKGEHVARVMRFLDITSDYDFAVPMDCDEFLILSNTEYLSSCPKAINAAFDKLIGERRALGVEMSFVNVIRRPGWFHAGYMPKSFLPARSVLDVDHGYHAVRSRLAEGVRRTPFCYLHFHHKPFAVLLEHARRKLTGRVDHHDLEALKNHLGDGHHLTKYFFMTKEEYEQDLQDVLKFSAPNFAREAAALGIDRLLFGRPVAYGDDVTEMQLPGARESPFQSERYLAANRDVRATGIDPLYHYLRYGWRERRPLG